MSDDKRVSRVRRILDSKRQPPEYQRLDIEPREGGRSLLHDEHGLPKVSRASEKKAPLMREISNKPIPVKAVNKRGMPSKSAEQSADDGFLPPKSNFVSVGQTDHSWYDESVTGPSEKMIDNNEEVDTESIQRVSAVDVDKNVYGIGKSNPLNPSDTSVKFQKRLRSVFSNIINEIETISSLKDLNDFVANIRSKNGILGSVIQSFENVPDDEKKVVGETVDQYFHQLNVELKSKEQELKYLEEDSEESDETIDEYDNEQLAEKQDLENLKDQVADSYDEQSEDGEYQADLSNIEEGQFGIFVKQELFTTCDTEADARSILTKLVVENNVALSDVSVLKRLSIDFGISFGERP